LGLLDSLTAAAQAMSVAEASAVLLAVVYLLLAIRQNSYCWFAAFFSSLLYLWVFFDARLYMESVLQIFYAAMAIFGWQQWRRGGLDGSGVAIVTWSLGQHVFVITGILSVSALVGGIMSTTAAVFPFLDSFTTVAAIVTTYMVARKVLENWAYWFVIDSLSVYLYLSRELYLTAALFCVYLIMIAVGFRLWWRDWRAAASA
jgi:nicotinamide mononucleotide transporter